MDQNLQELCNWVDGHFLKRRKISLNRDFSDAVLLAEILKEHYPKLVDLHNYGRKNAILKKLENWNILNRKVLCKLGLQLLQKEIENIAKCVPGSIEKLLFKVKTKTDAEKKQENIADDNNISEMHSGEVSEEVIQELDTKTEATDALIEKINNMQMLLHLKDQRISELQHKLDEFMATEKTKGGFFEIFTR